MPIARVNDHVEAGLDLLLEQYKEKPRIAALITADLNRIQELEDAAWDVLTSRLIDYATGIQLDVLGKLVGQGRISADDEVFRTRIRTRIRANQSLGHPNDIIAVVLSASGLLGSRVSYEELYPASFVVDTMDPIDDSIASLIHEFIRVAKALGTESAYLHSDEDEADTFAFSSSSDSPEDDEDRGFGNEDPDTGLGGHLVGIL